ncbi:hypothetical protein ACFL6M_06525 [Candidatus Eisenbacteria bacterium]|uniref:Uncharacterized protein n=1 Tax=Eiseniibacteriota bacterium TaxID=2212470 RepID=A0ABV6YLM9_UNCEI
MAARSPISFFPCGAGFLRTVAVKEQPFHEPSADSGAAELVTLFLAACVPTAGGPSTLRINVCYD